MKDGFIIGSAGGLFLNEFSVNPSRIVLAWSANPLESFVFGSVGRAEVVKKQLFRHSDLLVFRATSDKDNLKLSASGSIPWV